MTNIKVLGITLGLATWLAGCASSPTETPSAAQAVPPHPDAIQPVEWKVGDTCVNEYRFGGKRSVHTAAVTDVTGGRITFSDTADDGSVRVVVYEGSGGDHVAKRVALSDGQQIEFTPSMKWLDFPLKPGSAWTVEALVKGQTFQQLTLTSKFHAISWESVSVPAGQFAAVKLVTEEAYTAGRNNKGESFTGSGTVTVWMAQDIKCAIKWQYKNSFGARTTVQLVSYKAG